MTVILIALPAHTDDLPDIAVAVCAGDLPVVALPCMAIVRTGDLPIVALHARGHRKRDNLSIVALPAQAVNLPSIPVAARAGDLPVLAHVVPGHHKRGSLRHYPHHAWPLQARQFACTCARCANYLPDVTLAARAIDSPVVALAARAGNALLSPAAGRTLAFIASC